MSFSLNICFCNFDIEVWRTDLLFKLVKELDLNGHSCHYYNYKHDISGLSKDLGVPLTFHSPDTTVSNIDAFKPSSQLINEAGNYSFGLNKRHKKVGKRNNRVKANISDFIVSVDQLSNEIDIDLFVVWGGFRYKESSIISYAKSKGIKVVIFEYGYFRPYTLTFETKGLNFDNSLPRDPQFYLERYNESLSCRDEFDKIVKPQSAYFSEVDPVLASRFPRRKKAVNLTSLLKLKNVIYKKIKERSYSKVDLNQRYIFVPFQVETDSQIINFSNKIKTMKNLVALVSDSVERYNRQFDDNLKVIFKPHPVDKSVNIDYIIRNLGSYNSSLISLKENTQDLIANSELVITINSTVGIEALISGKNVITLGDAFYNIEGLVNNCLDYNVLHEVIGKTLGQELNFELVFKYIKYLREEYFSEIYYEGADKDSIKSLCNRLEGLNK